jgi:hypothetical protein
MKKIILAVLVFSGSFSLINAQTEQPVVQPVNPNAAEIKFASDVYDYGKIPKGFDGNCEFKFTNVGKEPLIISNAKGSCGCTVPSWPKEPIKPGDSGVIKVHYDTNRPGAISKTVTVTSNAKNTNVVLHIKGMVEVPPVEEPFPAKKADNNSGIPFEKTTTGFN